MWYIDFRCYDPISRTVKRKKYHISDKLSAREKRAYATNLIAGLVLNLQRGWNPWTQQSSERQSIGYFSISDLYRTHVKNN